ncbi:flavodoxin family protein [Clostridium grantii]|uniref:NADPH-dependent FMN reductase n=1 Tax=Clostridium grantii DSM 8605 TaxID=1121316 RepID=A0A1M5WP78_9CLOT|nr:flavodoxin family protein [Clostridium grantii]SHH89386.1 NADPH-dependent FMN reductase [Clostridium grantii DSM 8605]
MRQKWIAVVGSSRKGGNTELLTDYIISGLNEKGIDVEKYILDSEKISSCNGCEYCISTGICRINDNVSSIIDKMKVVDGYIFSSPSYNYNMTAQIKALLDRTFCLNDYEDGCKSRLTEDKRAIILGVCKGKTKESMGYTVEGMVKSLSDLEVKIVDVIEYYNTKDIPVEENKKIKKSIMEKIRCNGEL